MATRGPTQLADLFAQGVGEGSAPDAPAPEEQPAVSDASRRAAEEMVANLRSQAARAGIGEQAKRAVGNGATTAANRTASAPFQSQSPSGGNRALKAKRLSDNDNTRLPFWPEARRGVSNDMARSALFTVRFREPREHYRGHRVSALKNVEILYTGEELRQRDEDVLLQLLHFGRLSKVGDPIRFVAYEMLQQLGWTINSRSYRELAESIERMKASSLHILTRNGEAQRGFAGSLIRTFEYQTSGGAGAAKWIVAFEPRIIALFSHVAYTQIDWAQRLRLSPVTKWLHMFYYTHQHPFKMKVETLRELCGSSTRDLWRFRNALRASLDELVRVEFLGSWTIDPESDLVEVRRRHNTATIETPGPVV